MVLKTNYTNQLYSCACPVKESVYTDECFVCAGYKNRLTVLNNSEPIAALSIHAAPR